jgi:hypothetical protein
MKNITQLILFLSLLIPYTVAAESIPDCKLKDGRVENYIVTKTRQLQGHEYCQFRRYHSIDDIDGDNKDDFIVIFAVEGVHHSMGQVLQFMLVYLSSQPKSKPLEIQVGERGERTVKNIFRAGKNKIVTNDEVWQESDALCCPTGKGKSTYEIQNEKLIKSSVNKGIETDAE